MRKYRNKMQVCPRKGQHKLGNNGFMIMIEKENTMTDKAHYTIANYLCNRISTQTAGEIFMAVTPQKEHFKLAGFHARANPFNLCLYLFLNEASKHLFAHCSYNFSILLGSAEEQQNNTYMSPAATGCLKIHEVCHIHGSLLQRTEMSCEPKRQRHLNLFTEREDLHVTFRCTSLDRQIKNVQRMLETVKVHVWGKIPSD